MDVDVVVVGRLVAVPAAAVVGGRVGGLLRPPVARALVAVPVAVFGVPVAVEPARREAVVAVAVDGAAVPVRLATGEVDETLGLEGVSGVDSLAAAASPVV